MKNKRTNFFYRFWEVVGGALSSTLFPQDSSGSSKKGTKNQNYLQGEVADRQAT